ncbi:MAG: Tyrosine-specific transport protein, partial [Chlamydiae bacterium]|nr:Tyrosine-specific transport protein [Chlamydiota bacterium]
MISKTNRFIGAVLLVTGTTIGAGMLAIPISTGLSGFFPSLVLMTATWLFMMLTAFYLLEVNLRLRGETNIISMVHKTLGRPGEVITWIFYFFFFYSVLAAYLVGSSQLLENFIEPWINVDIPSWVWPVGSFLIFGTFVYFGTEVVDFLNRFLMLGLVAAYLVLIILGFFHVDLSMLGHYNWTYILPAASVVTTSFGYHVIIPTLTTYLEHDARLLRRAIFVGSFIPFVVYLLWQLLVLGTVPVEGEVSLSVAAEKGVQITFYLQQLINSAWVGLAARCFAFFAISTSILGVGLSLKDFLIDGLKLKQTLTGRLTALLLAFVPPLFFALFYPQGFIMALKYAGIFVVVLFALLPALMAWFERYGKQAKRAFVKSKFKVPGGKFA